MNESTTPRTERLAELISAAIAAMPAAEREARIERIRATGRHGTTVAFDGEWVHVFWADELLAIFPREVLDGEGPLPPCESVEVEIPDTVPADWFGSE